MVWFVEPCSRVPPCPAGRLAAESGRRLAQSRDQRETEASTYETERENPPAARVNGPRRIGRELVGLLTTRSA